jgi:hypothetical protein
MQKIRYKEIYEKDPSKQSHPKRLVEESEEYFEDLPNEGDDIEDISVYQNNKTRFLQHFM